MKSNIRNYIYILIALLQVFPSICTYAQDAERIVGKWKVIKVDNGVICDLQKGTVVVTPLFASELAGHKDSAMIVAHFTKLGKKYSDYYFNFRKDGLYQEIMNGEIRTDLSVYHLLEEEHIVYMRQASSVHDQEQNMQYEFGKENQLFLSITAGNKKMTFELMKVAEDKK